MGTSEYSPWQRLGPPWSGIPQKPGVYQIRWRCHTISRLLGNDEEGIMYVGCAKTSLRRRLRAFYYRVNGATGSPHAGGRTYAELNLADKVPVEELGYRWREAASSGVAMEMEFSELREYGEIFGEMPPLNSARPHSPG